VAATATPTETIPEPWAFSLPIELQSPANGAPVEIAILDTVPRMIDLQNAHATWVGDDQATPTLTPNPLLASLLGSPADGSFNVADQSLTPDTVGTPDQLDVIYLPNLPITDIEEHAYPMPSHGLFVAGIIRSIAPQAKLRLIQVLNDEGGGSLLSITQGLAYANRTNRGTLPLVINCSFAMRTPRVGDPLDAVDLVNIPQSEIDELTQLLSDQFAQTNQAFDLAIAAAAGNHGGGPVHPPARYPAAFPFVAGVAALKQDDNNDVTPPELNVYSDLADDQVAEGFAAFGGERSSSDPTLTDIQKGVLGVFIDTLPRLDSVTSTVTDDPNTTGWARWAGTSFATPIVSAVLANLIAGGDNAEVAISSLGTKLNDLNVGRNVPATQP
jgi:subtilisin family serine protease